MNNQKDIEQESINNNQTDNNSQEKINSDIENKSLKTRPKKTPTEDDKKEILNNIAYARFVRTYMNLFPITGDPLTNIDQYCLLKCFYNKENDNLVNNFRLIFSTRDIMKSSFIFMLSKLSRLVDIKYITLSDILDIQFDKSNIARNIKEIRAPLILVYIDNVTNKLKSEYFIRALEFWTRCGSSVWMFYKGKRFRFLSEYSGESSTITEFLKTKNCGFLELELKDNYYAFNSNPIPLPKKNKF